MTDLIASEDQMPLHEAVETEVVQASVVTALQVGSHLAVLCLRV